MKLSKLITVGIVVFMIFFCSIAADAVTGINYVHEELGMVIELDSLSLEAVPNKIAVSNKIAVRNIVPVPSIIEAEEIISDYYGEWYVSEQTDGTGPVKGSNYIKIYIPNSPSSAGSETDYIYMRFGSGYTVQLNGPGGSFPLGVIITWDLNDIEDYIEDIPQDRWDYISLETPSADGIFIDRVIVVHSSQEICDWFVSGWLDKWNGTSFGLAAKTLERKLEWINNTDHAAVHYGAREIGKTDGDKYGTSGAWCSEFASWCIRKDGFMTPKGSIGTADMKDWFDDRGRLYTRSEVKNKTYVPVEGDYLSLWSGGHSAVFIKWIDSTDTITDSTRFWTIEGNVGGRVVRTTRIVGDIDRVGRTK